MSKSWEQYAREKQNTDEIDRDMVGFFELLLKIDKRVNPENYEIAEEKNNNDR